MLKFRIIKEDLIPWREIESSYDSTIYKTRNWAEFLYKSQKVKPYVVEILQGEESLGFFYGQKIKKFGISMVVSPFEGWTTAFQGLSMLKTITVEERIEIYKQLVSFLFKSNECLFFQVRDWQFKEHDVEGIFNYENVFGYKLDMTQDFDTVIYKNFKEKSCKYSIKKALKNGIVVCQTFDVEQFAKNYYSQLIEVFAKQGLKPTYDINRIIDLANSLTVGKELLLYEAYLADNKTCVATGLFVRNENLAIYYGAASFQKYQNLCPNELLMYTAIKRIHELGTKEMEFGGGRKYKEKYGPVPFNSPRIILAKYSILIKLKDFAKKSYYGVRSVMSVFRK